MGFDLAFRCRDVNGNLTFPSQETIITLVEWITGQPANYTDWKPRWDAYQAMLNIPAAEQDETAIHNAWDLAHTDFTDYLLSDLQHGQFPRNRDAIAHACDLTDKRTAEGYLTEGETTDKHIIADVLDVLFPGLGRRLATVVDHLAWG